MDFFKNKANLDRLISLIKSAFMGNDDSTLNKLYQAVVLKIGQDASPYDRVDDDLGCAESASTIIHSVIPEFPILTGTYPLLEELQRSSKFQPTVFLRPGTVIIAATGTGNGKIRGHVGFMGENHIIISNDSATGTMLENFTYGSFYRKYNAIGGMKVHLFKAI